MIGTVANTTFLPLIGPGQDIRVREGSSWGADNLSPAFQKGKSDSPKGDDVRRTIDPKLLEEALDLLQETLRHVQPQVQLSVDPGVNQVVFRVLDKESGELIRQIPPETVLELNRFFADQSGLFIEEDI
jgi:flagellar protein FlaG